MNDYVILRLLMKSRRVGRLGWLLSICDKNLTGKSICCYHDWRPGDYCDQFRRVPGDPLPSVRCEADNWHFYK